MNGHVGAGIIIVGIAAFLFIMGIKGTQHQLFPQIFGAPSDNQGQQSTVAPGTNIPTNVPDKKGNCPSGSINVGGFCVQLGPPWI